MSTIKVTNIENPSTTSGGIDIDTSGHVTVDGVAYPSAGALSNRNKIINGNFDVWQRGTSFTLSTSFQYTADRWRAKVGTGGAGSISRNVGAGNKAYLTLAITTAGTGTHEFSQPIEFVSSVTGTDGASTPVSVSFRLARTSGTGTVDVSLLQYFGGGGSPSAAVSLPLGTITPTATATRYTLTGTLASIAGKTYGTNGDDQLVLIFTPSNDVASYDFSEIQVEPGSVATPFEHRSFGDELLRCMRYFEQSYEYGEVAGFGKRAMPGITYSKGANTTSECGTFYMFRVEKRSDPDIQFWDGAGNLGKCSRLDPGVSWNDNQTAAMNGAYQNNWMLLSSGGATGCAAFANWTANAEL